MANVLLLSQFFPPETGAGARRVGALAEALAAEDEVIVLTLDPSYPNPNLFTALNIAALDRQAPYRVIRAGVFRPHTRNLFLRGLREMKMVYKLVSVSRNFDADLVIVSTPSMFLGPLGRRLSRRLRAKFVWDLRDLTWRYGRDSADSGPLGRIVTQLLEAWMVKNLKVADLVLAATEGVREILVKEYILPADKVVTLANGVSRKFFDAFSERVEASSPPATVLYLGLLGYNHGIEVVLDAAKLLPDVQFMIVGDGPMHSMIETRINGEQLKNVALPGYATDHDEIITYYHRADILLNHTKDRGILNRTVVPAKFYEYMATGKPIVYGGKGKAVDFLEAIGCAEISPPEDPESLARGIRSLLADPGRASRMGELGRQYVGEHFIRETIMKSAVERIESIFLDH